MFDKLLQNFIILVILLFDALILNSYSNPINSETQVISYNEYKEYYAEFERKRADYQWDDTSGDKDLTSWDIFGPFIQTFQITFIIISIIVLFILCICLCQACNWDTLCTPMEYLPCFGHKILKKRLDRFKYPGIYIKDNGTKEFYKTIANESKIYNDIVLRLATDA